MKLNEEQKQFIKEHCQELSDKEIQEIINIDKMIIYRYRRSIGIRKSKEFIARKAKEKMSPNFLKSCYSKGHVPMNKGKKMEEYTSPESMERIRKTQFKPGNIPPQHKKLGDITWRVDSHGRGYYWIKFQDKSKVRNMMPLHRYLWEKENGPIPDGFIVVFKDRNTRNCNIENLEMIPFEENMKRNTIHRYPDELRKTIRLVSKANKLINNERNRTERSE